MLYDILFIDDDFEESNVEFGEPETTNLNALKTMRLFSTLIGVDNLRVTYTTGEKDDIERLESKDLSCIKFIFCDLHLIGISDGSPFKIINSKIIGVFRALDTYIKSKNVVIYINSKYFNDNYGDDGLKDLKTKLRRNNFLNKYSVETITEKNNLPPENKKELVKNSINIYSLQLILNKAIEVEKIFDKKLKLSESTCEKLSFDHKYSVFQSQYKLGDFGEHVKLLMEIRNKLAHTNGEIQKIKDGDGNKKKLFWKNCSDQERTDPIEFKNFNQLMKYIESIDKLIENLDMAVKKS